MIWNVVEMSNEMNVYEQITASEHTLFQFPLALLPQRSPFSGMQSKNNYQIAFRLPNLLFPTIIYTQISYILFDLSTCMCILNLSLL